MPDPMKSTRKDPRKRAKECSCRARIADAAASPMTAKLAIVTRAPPKRSAMVPPIGRLKAPRSAPRKASEAVTSGNWVVSSVGKAAE